MTDRQLFQQALDALETISEFAGGEGDVCEIIAKRARLAIPAMRERLAQCDRCGKKLGGEGDIHTCTPDPIGDAQDRLIAELAAQPEQEPVAWMHTMIDDVVVGHRPADLNRHPERWKPLVYANTIPHAAQPAQQEPYGWVQPNPSFNSGIFNLGSACPSGWVGSAIAVHTAPPTAAQPAPATDNTATWSDELALIESVLKGYPDSIAKADALRAVRGLQATPPAAQRTWMGLTDEEILKLAYPIRWQEVDDFEADKAVNFAQAIEAKLKEKNGWYRQHVTDGSPCWCEPEISYTNPETGASVIVHKEPQ